MSGSNCRMGNDRSCMVVWTFSDIALLWNCNENLYLFCGHFWVFQICWHTEWSTVTASSLGILNSSAGILSCPLALFVVMLSKAHLTSRSRMSISNWVITLSWFSGALSPFMYNSSAYTCHLLLISSASVRSLPLSVLYHAHPCMKCSLSTSNFREEIASLTHSIVLLYFLALFI